MPTQFKYRALAADGTQATGIMSAEDTEQVLERLNVRKLIPITIEKTTVRKPFSIWGFSRHRHYENVIQFTSNLATMYKAGIPLLRALSLIKIGAPGGRFNQALQEIKSQVEGGRSLSQAIADHDDLFSKVFAASIAAGEESGKLDRILDELNTMLTEEMELTRALKSGIRYPAMVITAVMAAFIVLVAYVIPKFVTFYGQFGAELPLPTKVLIGLSDFFTAYWAVLLAIIIMLIIGLRKMVATEKGKLWVDKKLLKAPVLGNLIIKGNVARFSMMFHILFQAGLPIVQALGILSEVVKNSAIAVEVTRIGELLKAGRDTDLNRDEFEYFPEMSLQMITIGLESGSLAIMLQQIAVHFSREVKYVSRNLTSILEPILTLVLGAFVLIMALAIFLPMWNLVKVFNG